MRDTHGFVVQSDGDFTVKGGASSAKVVTADVKACTTIVHVIDSVLLSCPLPDKGE